MNIIHDTSATAFTMACKALSVLSCSGHDGRVDKAIHGVVSQTGRKASYLPCSASCGETGNDGFGLFPCVRDAHSWGLFRKCVHDALTMPLQAFVQLSCSAHHASTMAAKEKPHQ